MVEAFAVAVDGKIDIRTVCESRRGAIVNWLFVQTWSQVMVFTSHTDEDIERLWERNRRLGSHRAEVVEVTAEIKLM